MLVFPRFYDKIPVPEEYCGREFFYTNQNDGGDFDDESNLSSQLVVINDNEDMLPISKQKKDMEVGSLPKSLEDAIVVYSQWRNKEIRRCSEKHDTMLVNVTTSMICKLKARKNI